MGSDDIFRPSEEISGKGYAPYVTELVRILSDENSGKGLHTRKGLRARCDRCSLGVAARGPNIAWDFDQEWHGNHLSPEWKKWTVDEAKAMFAAHGLTHPVRQLNDTKERF